MDWENAWMGLLYGMCVFCVISFFMFAFSSKKFNGYYLHQYQGEHSVYINWDNSPDEVAYTTYDGKEALDVFNRLTGGAVNEKQTPAINSQ